MRCRTHYYYSYYRYYYPIGTTDTAVTLLPGSALACAQSACVQGIGHLLMRTDKGYPVIMGNVVYASICIDAWSHWIAAQFQENRIVQAERENISFTWDKQDFCFSLAGSDFSLSAVVTSLSTRIYSLIFFFFLSLNWTCDGFLSKNKENSLGLSHLR